MKALVYTGPKKAEYLDVAMPEPKPGQVRIRVSYCGVCGGDIGIHAGKHPRAKAPLVFGHEFIGTVESINGGSGKIKVGDKVSPYPLISCGHCAPCSDGYPHVCKTLKLIGIDIDGGMAEYVCCDEDVLFKVPDNLSDKAAGVIEPLAVIIHTLHQAQFKSRDTVAILGAGPIGILTAIVARDSGASQIVISDIDDGRLALAKELGFNAVNTKEKSIIETVDEITEGVGADIVFECAGVESAVAEATKICRIRGTICLTAIYKGPTLVTLPDMNFKELNMVSSRVYTKREYKQAVDYAKNIESSLEKLVTHEVKLSEAEKVFDMIHDPSIQTVKLLIDCR